MCNLSRLRSMALDSSGKQPEQQQQQPPRASPGIGEAGLKLRKTPNEEHEPDSYEDLQLDFSPVLFSSLERYLPEQVLNSTRRDRVRFMRDLLLRYSPDSERIRIQRHREYREKILSSYQRLHVEIYSLDPGSFFAPSFLNALHQKSEQGLRSIMVQTSPGIFTFEMLNPRFCQMLLAEVEHMEKWVYDSRTTIMRPNTLNKFGVVLDDFGFESMLKKLVDEFISPISQVLFPEVCGTALDSHHGFIVEYGKDRDADLGFHVDDSEVSLNVCLGKQFSGGDLYFRGVRCDNHVNSEISDKEIYDYSHVPGQAVLHRGRHRHGARATTEGHRVNLILWCRSSSFREMKNYQKDFSGWCGECRRVKLERQKSSIEATKQALIKIGAEKSLVELASKSSAD
uniref:Putative PKHD-type hydroxylase n=1 Tax=Noccaea caerulescens TaxID=107243 RepID=A0A1J3IG80_NOCCA